MSLSECSSSPDSSWVLYSSSVPFLMEFPRFLHSWCDPEAVMLHTAHCCSQCWRLFDISGQRRVVFTDFQSLRKHLEPGCVKHFTQMGAALRPEPGRFPTRDQGEKMCEENSNPHSITFPKPSTFSAQDPPETESTSKCNYCP